MRQAVGGSPPLNKDASTLFVGRPNTPDLDVFLGRARRVLTSGRLTNDGPVVRELEQRVCEILEVNHAVATCSATLGMQIAARSLGLSGEIIMPSFTFVATAHAFEWIGMKPVFVDIDPSTHCINPCLIEQSITDQTSAIVGVHLWGMPCDIPSIEAVANSRGLQVLYDASHAFNSSWGGRKVGNFGRCEVFSFHATKFVHSFEGGVVTTNDADLADRMRLMRNFGLRGNDDVASSGTNAKMPEISALMGNCCLDELDEFTEINRRNYGLYQKHLRDIPGIRLFACHGEEQGNFQYVVIEVDETGCAVTRDHLVDALGRNGVVARRYFWPGCHRSEPYRSLGAVTSPQLHETDKVAARVLVLPNGSAVGESEVRRVCSVIGEAVAG